MRFINRRKRFYSVGADTFRPDLDQAKKARAHDDYILCDIRRLPLRSKSFDVVLSLEVLEHLEREEGKALLKSMEEIGRRQVIISTPRGEFRHCTADGNPQQEHKSAWYPGELRAYGYKIRGYGLPMPGGIQGWLGRLPEPLRSLRRFLWVLTSPITYFVPELAGWMVCTKKLEEESTPIWTANKLGDMVKDG